MVVIAAGLFIGLSGFQQYALESSRSLADTVLCAPDRPVTVPGRTVTFTVAGLDAGTLPYWTSAEGKSEAASDGTYSVVYATRGTKTVSAFFLAGDLWQRTTCVVSVQ
jgi:hypothetical protein